MVMSLTSLLTLQLATLAEYDQLHGEILSKEELAETTKQRILQLVKAIQDGRFNLERYLEQAEVLERTMGELGGEMTELMHVRDLKAERRKAISELMKQTDDASAKKTLRRERAELGTFLEDLGNQIETLRATQEQTRVERLDITRKVESLEIQLGTLEREFQPIQKNLVSFEDKCTELELKWLSRLIEHKLGDEGNPERIEPLAIEFLESGMHLMKKCVSGEGIFRRDFQETQVPPLLSELQIWALALKDEAALSVFDTWPVQKRWIETYHGFRFAIGETLRKSDLRGVAERLEEFRAYEGLIGAMARALFTVGRTSQTESQIALTEWLRLEAQFARAEVVDEARIQSGSSKRLFDLWVGAHSKAP